MAGGVPVGVSMNCTDGSGEGWIRRTGSAKNIAYDFVPSALNT
jgi:hypothetical protein